MFILILLFIYLLLIIINKSVEEVKCGDSITGTINEIDYEHNYTFNLTSFNPIFALSMFCLYIYIYNIYNINI